MKLFASLGGRKSGMEYSIMALEVNAKRGLLQAIRRKLYKGKSFVIIKAPWNSTRKKEQFTYWQS
jgi:hypothetical protein